MGISYHSTATEATKSDKEIDIIIKNYIQNSQIVITKT